MTAFHAVETGSIPVLGDTFAAFPAAQTRVPISPTAEIINHNNIPVFR